MAQFTVAQALQRGVESHQAGNIREAERFYQAVIGASRDNAAANQDLNLIAQAHNNLGVAQQQLGELNAAIESFREAVRIKPDYLDVYHNLAHALRVKGDLKGSVNCYRKVVELKPDDADAYNNLGAAQQHIGDLDGAIDSYRRSVKLDPDCAEAYNNMGSAYQARDNLGAAVDSFNKALEIKPDYANAYDNLGHALHDQGDLEGSIESYRRALKITPDSPQTHNNLGNALREIGNYDEAVRHFDAVSASESDPSRPLFWLNSSSQSIECLYSMERYKEVRERLAALGSSGENNLRVAAVSAFVSHQLKIEDPVPFCPRPLDFVHKGSLNDHLTHVGGTGDIDGFVEKLIGEASNENLLWEPKHGVTEAGFQTSPTIFSAGETCKALENILRQEIATYHARFQSESCTFITDWPAAYDLRGWFVRLVQNGHQRPHNHPSGWLSGVVYLKTIDSPDGDEGAIEFSLHGHNLPVLDDSFARQVHRPEKGDIVLFPSSLFHRTIPFTRDTDRCVIAFDLYRYPH